MLTAASVLFWLSLWNNPPTQQLHLCAWHHYWLRSQLSVHVAAVFWGPKNNQRDTRKGTLLNNNSPLCFCLSSVTLQENAVNGDHLWMETSCSGELCYLGEDACLLKTAVSITVHHTDSLISARWKQGDKTSLGLTFFWVSNPVCSFDWIFFLEFHLNNSVKRGIQTEY